MAEQEKSSSVFMVDKDLSNVTGKQYKPNEILEDANSDIHQKRSKVKAPTLPSVNDLKADIEEQQNPLKEPSLLNDTEEPVSDGCKSESIVLANLEVRPSKKVVAPVQSSKAKPLPDLDVVGKDVPKDHADRDSITDEITDLNPNVSRAKHEWLDDEEADGLGPLPRNESRASRISRAVRQWFCCGYVIEAPSDEEFMDYEDEQQDGI